MCVPVALLLPLPSGKKAASYSPVLSQLHHTQGWGLAQGSGWGRGEGRRGMGNGRGRTLRFHPGHFEQDQVGGREREPHLPAEAKQWSPPPHRA